MDCESSKIVEQESVKFKLWINESIRFGPNRPLALTGYVTNASFKQWLEILLMTKIDREHKNYLTREIWEEKHLREIFYGTLIFQQSSMICIGRANRFLKSKSYNFHFHKNDVTWPLSADGLFS